LIEVEKKFLLSDQDIALLLENSQFLGQVTFTDIYFDTKDFKLISQYLWLRKRDNSFELKVPLTGTADSDFDQYQELTNEQEIKDQLKLGPGKMDELLANRGYLAFAKIVTTRKKYKKDEFTIDLDLVDYGYSIGEIELMVEREDQVEEAIKRIMEFAKKHHLKIVSTRGKVIEYLARNYPKDFRRLVKEGVFKG
jgi:thiamine-triphosphatase